MFVKIVTQVKLMPDAVQAPALDHTLPAINEAANWVSLLGLHISRAEKWTKEAGSTRADYAAEFSHRGTDAHT
ncbi:hypothetical protein [Streptomyces sp. HUAS ZL42]|uniref:hypothetical protein n=1 Tax=Streptomyces sp. HUAS ZL42 TaxID=3231715 RepID=UPI00345E91A6